jgi:TRAP-type mannitol/chloroaromatic compound transport system permease small subunit
LLLVLVLVPVLVLLIFLVLVLVVVVVPSGPLSARTGDSVKLLVRACLCSFRSL